MRIEFTQTLEDYREAHLAGAAAAAARPTPPTRAVMAFWHLGSAAIEATLCLIWNPFEPHTDQLGWFMSVIAIPTLPWLLVLAYLLHFQILNSRAQPAFEPPWQRPKVRHGKPPKPQKALNLLRSGSFIMAAGLALMVMGGFVAKAPVRTAGDLAFWGWGLSWTCWGVYLIWGGAVNRISRNGQVTSSWRRLTHLHELNIFEFDALQVVQETPLARTVMQWNGIAGFIESENLFLLYRSPGSFYIIPKRAFASAEMVAAFRNMVTNLAGKGPAAFPVLPASAAAR